MIQIIECEQNSPEWLLARAGIPTASSFKDVLAKGEGKTRRTYLLKLAGEIMTGVPTESISNEDTERGHAMEPEAREAYVIRNDYIELTHVGFVRNGYVGCSPDALIGADGILEIKTKKAHVLADVILKGGLPSEHVAQCQGALWVCEREWLDFVAYWPRMPLYLHRVYRDEKYIKNLAAEVERFNADLAEAVERLRRHGKPSTLAADLKASANLLGASS